MKIKNIKNARTVAMVGLMAATVECAKLVLAAIPNIEVVTLLLAVYGYVFGWLGVASAVLFVCIEPLVWGIGPWVITYAIYWPSVAAVFMLLRRINVKNRWALSGVAVLMTFTFGILSSVVEGVFLFGLTKRFFANIILYYSRGIPFYITQIACNAVTFTTLFSLVRKKLAELKISTFFD